MKLIKKSIVDVNGVALEWHAVVNTHVNIQAKELTVEYGSWSTLDRFESGLHPIATGSTQVYFRQWDESILYHTMDFLVRAGPLEGGEIVDLTRVADSEEGLTEIFDVGAMP